MTSPELQKLTASEPLTLEEEYEIDKIVTKKTMYHLQDFFNEKVKKYIQ